MYLTDIYKYFNSLRKEEIPVTGFVYLPDKSGDPSPGSLIPIGYLTDPTWKFLPLSGYYKALDAVDEEGGSGLEHYEHLSEYSVDDLNELYKLKPCLAEEDINLDVAKVLYDATHHFSKWEKIEPFQRSQYIAELAGTIDSSNGLNKNIKAEVSAENIAAKKTACSCNMLYQMIEKALSGVVNHFTGAPMFIECKNFNVWKFRVKE